MTYEERRKSWEEGIEKIIIEMICEKSEQGLKMGINAMPAIREFNHLLADIDTNRKAQKYWLSPGDPDKESL